RFGDYFRDHAAIQAVPAFGLHSFWTRGRDRRSAISTHVCHARDIRGDGARIPALVSFTRFSAERGQFLARTSNGPPRGPPRLRASPRIASGRGFRQGFPGDQADSV